MAKYSIMVLGSNRLPSIQIVDTTNLGIYPIGERLLLGRQRLPDESVGNINISFSGVKPGSEIHIIDIDKNILASDENVSGSPSFSIPRYLSGTAKNTVRIVIVSIAYEVVDLSYELPSIDTTIPIFQRIDRNYRNPS